MEYVVRLPASESFLKTVKDKAISMRPLPAFKDYYFKPRYKEFNTYNPKEVCIRLRDWINELNQATLTKITIHKSDTGYTHTDENLGSGTLDELRNLAKKLDYEEWGEMERKYTEFILSFKGVGVTVIVENMDPAGRFIKIISSTKEDLDRVLKLLEVSNDQLINENSASLLARKLNLL